MPYFRRIFRICQRFRQKTEHIQEKMKISKIEIAFIQSHSSPFLNHRNKNERKKKCPEIYRYSETNKTTIYIYDRKTTQSHPSRIGQHEAILIE